MKRSIRFRVYHIVHNMIAHPLLPVADYLAGGRFNDISNEIYKFHDNTTPIDDPYNMKRFDHDI